MCDFFFKLYYASCANTDYSPSLVFWGMALKISVGFLNTLWSADIFHVALPRCRTVLLKLWLPHTEMLVLDFLNDKVTSDKDAVNSHQCCEKHNKAWHILWQSIAGVKAFGSTFVYILAVRCCFSFSEIIEPKAELQNKCVFVQCRCVLYMISQPPVNISRTY